MSFLCDTVGVFFRESLDASSRGMDPHIFGYAFGEASVDIWQEALAGVHMLSFPFSNYGWFCLEKKCLEVSYRDPCSGSDALV